MIKRTLYFGNPCRLSTHLDQMVIKLDVHPGSTEQENTKTIPIEDIGVVVLDNPLIHINHHLMFQLMNNNVALIISDPSHHPVGLMLNLNGNTLQSQKFKAQIEASIPLKKQLWQQTIKAKIGNQLTVLKNNRFPIQNMEYWMKNVRSGDPDGYEARAAAYYWETIFKHTIPNFKRERDGSPPNNFLNYGYAIMRATIARALVGSGLLPTLGIFHRNQYNAYCLADDMMEPYRPIVDQVVIEMIQVYGIPEELESKHKRAIFELLTADVYINGEKSPLLVAASRTSASLAKAFTGESKRLLFPVIKQIN